jgi:DNA repair protein RadC
VPAYPRLVVETALNHNAYGVVLCHNHPGGDATPSPDDIMATRNIQSMLAQLGILVLDHVIVSGGQVHSMLLHGELPMPENMMDPNCHEDVQLSGWLDERTHDA